jgi:TPR repeat protein
MLACRRLWWEFDMISRLLSLLWLVAALAATTNASHGAGRVALVIGIDRYAHLSPLANPERDARAIAELLRGGGFRVIERFGPAADFVGLSDALAELEAAAPDEALIYFAGHGFALEKTDVLAPHDIEVDCDLRTAKRFVRLEELFQRIEDVPRKVVLLDACRNDPFPACPKRGGAAASFRNIGFLGRNSSGLLVASSTLSGSVASDGPADGHSPFASAFLRIARENPAAPMRDVLDEAAAEVARLTGNAQVPEIITRGGAPRMCLAENCAGAQKQEAVAALPGAAAGNADAETCRRLVAVSEAGLNRLAKAGIGEAQSACERAAEADPSTPRLAALAGFAYFAIQNIDKARVWFSTAAEAGDTAGMLGAGALLQESDPVAANAWFARAAAAGDGLAMLALGTNLARGSGIAKDEAAAIGWYRKAAALGETSAMTMLGHVYRQGEGVAADTAEAFSWYRKAAQAGEPRAMRYLSLAYANGSGAPVEPEESARWLLEALKAGDGMTEIDAKYGLTEWPAAAISAIQRQLAAAGKFSGSVDGRDSLQLRAALLGMLAR